MSELSQTLVDLNSYSFSGKQSAELPDFSTLSDESKRELRMVGVDVDAAGERAGTFLQFDHSTVHCKSAGKGVEVLGIRQALKKYDGLPEYFWSGPAAASGPQAARGDGGEGFRGREAQYRHRP